MAPSTNYTQVGQVNAVDNVDYAREARQTLLLKELALNRRDQACEYVVEKYHEFEDRLNSHPEYGIYRRQVVVLGKNAAGQATRIVCDVDGLDQRLKALRSKANEYKEHEILEQYQGFLKQLGHLKVEAKEVLGEVAANAAEEQAAKVKALRDRAQNYRKNADRTEQAPV